MINETHTRPEIICTNIKMQNKFKGKAKHCLVPLITRNISLQSVRKPTQKSGSLPSR